MSSGAAPGMKKKGERKKVQKFKDGRTIAGNGMVAADFDPKSNEGDYVPSGKPVPARVDLRKYCSAIENQEQTNSCCANAIAGAYEYMARRHAARTGDKVPEVSRLFIYFVGRKWDLQRMGRQKQKVQDGGMSIPGAVDALHDAGACVESVWPYEVTKVNKKPAGSAFELALNCKISASKKVPVDVSAMKAALADGHTILTGLKLTKRFFRPGKSGKITTPDPSDPKSAAHGLHAMLIVGYSDKKQVFIYRNSWGERWGDKGYGYVPYSYAANPAFNFCGQYAILGLTDMPEAESEDEADDDSICGDSDGEVSDLPDSGSESGDSDRTDSEDDDDCYDKRKLCKKVFRKWDVNESGNLREFELLGALNNMGHRCALNKVREIQEKNDTDGVPGTNYPEWLRINGIFDDSDDEAGASPVACSAPPTDTTTEAVSAAPPADSDGPSLNSIKEVDPPMGSTASKTSRASKPDAAAPMGSTASRTSQASRKSKDQPGSSAAFSEEVDPPEDFDAAAPMGSTASKKSQASKTDAAAPMASQKSLDAAAVPSSTSKKSEDRADAAAPSQEVDPPEDFVAGTGSEKKDAALSPSMAQPAPVVIDSPSTVEYAPAVSLPKESSEPAAPPTHAAEGNVMPSNSVASEGAAGQEEYSNQEGQLVPVSEAGNGELALPGNGEQTDSQQQSQTITRSTVEEVTEGNVRTFKELHESRTVTTSVATKKSITTTVMTKEMLEARSSQMALEGGEADRVSLGLEDETEPSNWHEDQ